MASPEPALTPGPTHEEAVRILAPLRAGVVPPTGFQHFCVGRSRETAAVLADVDLARRGRSAVRVVVGPYGAGKSFTLALARSAARGAKMATTTADLSPDRRFYGGDGVARALYSELVKNLATSESPEGGALTGVLDCVLERARSEAEASDVAVTEALDDLLVALHELSLGYVVADVVRLYCRARLAGDRASAARCGQWLRGEFSTKAEAHAALGVRNIVTDRNCWDALKALVGVMRLAGLHGLLACVDELVNVQKLPTSRARNDNLEQILKIVNDCLQGSTAGLVVYLGATPEALENPRTGLFSYEALRSRLAPHTVLQPQDEVGGRGPVLHLAPLTAEEGYMLLWRLRHVHAEGDTDRYRLPDEALTVFLTKCYEVMGAAAYQTPRGLIIQFLSLLDALDEREGLDWTALASGAAHELAPRADADFDDLQGDVL